MSSAYDTKIISAIPFIFNPTLLFRKYSSKSSTKIENKKVLRIQPWRTPSVIFIGFKDVISRVALFYNDCITLINLAEIPIWYNFSQSRQWLIVSNALRISTNIAYIKFFFTLRWSCEITIRPKIFSLIPLSHLKPAWDSTSKLLISYHDCSPRYKIRISIFHTQLKSAATR